MTEKDKERKRTRIYRRCLAGFFLVIFVCTLISRIYDSITVPKVLCQRMKEKSVEHVITGTGLVRETGQIFYRIEPGLRVGSVEVDPGSRVEEGQVLFAYDLVSLKENQELRQQELEKLRLQLEREILSGETYSQVTETELAAWELHLAERALEEGRQEHEEKYEKHLQELERLKKEYEQKRDRTREELWIQQDEEEEAARQELRSAKNSRDSDLREARRKVSDLEEERKEMEDKEDGGKELARVERELDRAREDLEALEEDWEDRIDGAESRMDLIEDRSERISFGETSTQEALWETYEASVRQQEADWEEQEKNLKSLEREVEKARWNMEIASKRDESARLDKEQKKRMSLLARQELELDIKEKEQELRKLQALVQDQGQVLADRKGTVVEQEVLAGKTASGQERLSLADGSFCFEGEFEKEEQKVAVGDCLTVSIPGSDRNMEAVIEEIRLVGEKGVFRAGFSEEGLALGTVTGYECRKQSDIYRQVIPIQALRKDTKGYYCLVARPRKAILGEEFRAERVDVRVQYEGNTEVAVEGGILASDPIIVRGNQVIQAGDRVRVVETLGE